MKQVLAAGGYTTVNTVGSGFTQPIGINLDAAGNVFVADAFDSSLYEIVAAGGYTTVNTIGSGFSDPQSVSVDGSGSIFVADAGDSLVKKLVSAAQKLPTTAVGSTSVSLSVPFTFDSGGSIGAPVVLTQGAPSLDFADAGTGTCTTTSTYNAGDTCTVDVTFSPVLPGSRKGAVMLNSAAGIPLATGYVYGTGTGSQVAYATSALSTMDATSSGPYAVAADTQGNAYVATYLSTPSAAVLLKKETLSGGSYTTSTIDATITTTSGVYPGGVAVDGAGNIYFSYGSLYVETPQPGGAYSRSTITVAGSNIYGVAVDGAGDIFFTTGSSNKLEGLALDSSGNIYVAAGFQGRRSSRRPCRQMADISRALSIARSPGQPL